MTYDFETSQNLIWCEANRAILKHPLHSELHTNLFRGAETNADIWNHNNFHWTTEQIPQQYKKTHTIHFPRLGHGKVYRHRDWTSKDNYNFLIPGAQGITKITDKSGTNGVNISDQQENLSLESVTAPSDAEWTYSTIFTLQPQVAYPSIRLAQPSVPDETGVMKFRYQIRLTTQLELFPMLSGVLGRMNSCVLALLELSILLFAPSIFLLCLVVLIVVLHTSLVEWV